MGLNRSRILTELEINFLDFKFSIKIIGMASLVLQDKLDECPNIEIIVDNEELYNSLPGEESEDQFNIDCKYNGIFVIRRDCFGCLYDAEYTLVYGYSCQTVESIIDLYRIQSILLRMSLETGMIVINQDDSDDPYYDTLKMIEVIDKFADDIESKNKNNEVL